MGGGCSREEHPEGGYVFHYKDTKSAFNAAAHPMEHHLSGGSTINASFPYVTNKKMEMDGGALRTSSDCDGWHTNDLDSIIIHTQHFKPDRAVLYLTGKGKSGKETIMLTPDFGNGWKNIIPYNFFNNYYIKKNHFAAEPGPDEVYIDKLINTHRTEHGLWDYDFVSNKRKIINEFCPEANENKSGWTGKGWGWFRFIYDRKAIEKLHKNHVTVNSPQFKGDWGKLAKKYCEADINNRIDHVVGKGTVEKADGTDIALTCLATNQSYGDEYCRRDNNIEKTICRAYDDFELVASEYCKNENNSKNEDNRKKPFCGCANAVEIDFCDNKGGEQSKYPGCAETEGLWKEINNGLMDRDRRFFKNRRKCHYNVCDSSRYQPTGWENGCDASYVVCTNNANIKGDLINSNYSVTQDCKINTSGEIEFEGDVGKRTPENIFIDDATKETKLFEKIFAVEGEKHDAWYERRMYHIMSSSSSCIIAILMGMGLIVI